MLILITLLGLASQFVELQYYFSISKTAIPQELTRTTKTKNPVLLIRIRHQRLQPVIEPIIHSIQSCLHPVGLRTLPCSHLVRVADVVDEVSERTSYLATEVLSYIVHDLEESVKQRRIILETTGDIRQHISMCDDITERIGNNLLGIILIQCVAGDIGIRQLTCLDLHLKRLASHHVNHLLTDAHIRVWVYLLELMQKLMTERKLCDVCLLERKIDDTVADKAVALKVFYSRIV